MLSRLDDSIDHEGLQYIGRRMLQYHANSTSVPQYHMNSTSRPCYLWVGLGIHIVYGPADPHIIQITIILILSYALIHFGCLQLENDGDFLYLLADAAAIAVCLLYILFTSLSVVNNCCTENTHYLQFQYGNPDVLCSPLVVAKKNGTNIVVSSTII
jgi:hypothetical protein